MIKRKKEILGVLLVIFALTFLMGAPDPRDIIGNFAETISFASK